VLELGTEVGFELVTGLLIGGVDGLIRGDLDLTELVLAVVTEVSTLLFFLLVLLTEVRTEVLNYYHGCYP
jgi:hypothetical protein